MTNVLDREEYKFLKTLDKNIQYLTYGGSHAYGTNNKNSDIDIRGFYLESKEEVYGIKEYQDVFVHEETDTVLYSFKKLVQLLTKCNPNTIELLGTLDEHKFLVSDLAKDMLDNKEIFLSKIAFSTFAGYATAQLRRLENALARDHYDQEDKERHIQKSLESAMLHPDYNFQQFGEENTISLYIDDAYSKDYTKEIFVDINVKHVPLREYISRNNAINNMLRNYGKLNHRNHKKDDNHLNKHAMHLVRLYLMGIDILQKHEINTYRKDKHDMLMAIRNGDVPFEDVFKMQKEYDAAMKKALDESTLPKLPDYDKINDFVVSSFKKYL